MANYTDARTALEALIEGAEERAQVWFEEHFTPEARWHVERARERFEHELRAASTQAVAAMRAGVTPGDARAVWEAHFDAACEQFCGTVEIAQSLSRLSEETTR